MPNTQASRAPRRLPVVGVMGDGKRDYPELTGPLGKMLASLDVHLLTGAGAGVMRGVCMAFASEGARRGLVVGIVPACSVCPTPYKTKEGYPNEFIELAILTHLPGGGEAVSDPLTRNHINILSSDFVVILPGGPGTALETELVGAYGKPFFKLVAVSQIAKLESMIKRHLIATANQLT